ncbi:MAG: type II CAAX endopeptidase family protein [Chloroflexota bacterium]
MLENIQRWIKQHPLITFFLLAYGISWSLGGLLIARRNGWLEVPEGIHYLIAFGPLIASVIVTAVMHGRSGLVDLWSRITRWRVGWLWLIIGCLSPLILFLMAMLISFVATGKWPDFALFAKVNYLGIIGIPAAFLLWLATFGFGEEIGWRGFALPQLQQRFGLLTSALILGVFWALWHLPQFFYHEPFMAMGIGGFVGFAISIIMGSILLAWLYNHANASILVVALWHGCFDFLTSPMAKEPIAALMSMAVIVWVIAIIVAMLRRRTNGVSADSVLSVQTHTTNYRDTNKVARGKA